MATLQDILNSDNGIDHRWDLFKDDPSLVEQRIKDAQGFASGAYQVSMAALQALQGILQGLQLINRTIAIDTTTITTSVPTETPPKIDMNKLQINMPALLASPSVVAVSIDPFPDFPNLVVGTLVPPVENYKSALKDDLSATILACIQNSQGIPPEIEQLMFLRGYERDILVHQDAQDKIAEDWSASAFPMPNGALKAALDRETMEFSNHRLDTSRDISIKSFELALQNFHFMIEKGIAWEGHLMDYAHAVATLALQGAEAVIRLTIDAFKETVVGVKEKILGILEKVRAYIEYNKGLIDIYTAQIQGYTANIQGQSAAVNANARGYEAETAVFRATTDWDLGKAGLDLKVIEAKIQQAIENANLMEKDKEIEMKNYEMIKNLMVEGMKAIATVAAQLSSGAMAGIHVSAAMSASDSAQYSAGSAPIAQPTSPSESTT